MDSGWEPQDRAATRPNGARLRRLFVVMTLAVSGGVVLAATSTLLPSSPANAGVGSDCLLDGSSNPNQFGALTGVPNPALGLPSAIGTLKALMLFVDFTDVAGVENTTTLFNNLTGASHTWQNEVSYGRFVDNIVTMPGLPWLHMSGTAASYNLGSTITTAHQRDYMNEAVTKAIAAGANAALFSGVQLLYVVAADTTSTPNPIPNSPAFVGGSGFPVAVPLSGATPIPAGATFGHDIRFPSTNYASWILAHETEHTLGLPDLYSFADIPAGYDATHKYNGGWDHMDAIVTGGHIHAWEKLQLGWLDASQLPCVPAAGGTYALTPLETMGGVKGVVIRTSATRAIVAEDRLNVAGTQDSFLCDHGLLVYSVDASVASGSGPVRVLPGSNAEVNPSTGYTNCGRLYNATFDAGRAPKPDTFTDSVSGLSIKVNTDTSGNLGITVTVPSPYVPPTTTTTTSPSTSTTTTTPGGGGTGVSKFVAVQPERLLETRASVGQIGYTGGKPAAGQTVTLQVSGVGTANVPSSAAAVALNVTGVDATDDGYVTVFPCGSTRPTASNLNLVKGATAPNLVITKLGTNGTVCLYTQSGADLIADVSGYFTAGTSVVSVQPERLLDTRSPNPVGYVGAKPVAGQTVTLQVTGAGATKVPVSSSAVVLNVTGVGATADGYVTVWPCDQGRPTASNLNLVKGSTAPNLVVVKLSAAGTVCLFTQSGADLLADVAAYFTASATFSAITPRRLLDTRPPTVGYTGPKPTPGQTVTVAAVDAANLASTGAVVLNVTGIGATGDGYVTVYPCGSSRPTASNLNLVQGSTAPNLVIVKVGTGGTVCLYTQSGADLAVDISGSFTP